jgi:TetR/AcrR family transcriptional repressor of nem operon
MSNSATALATGSTREQILAVARSLIETRSYLGFSFQDVADAIGIRKASLYHHFPTKKALGIAVIRQATQQFKDWDAARVRAPADALESYFRMYRNTLKAGAGMCPAGALAPGWDCIEADLRQAVQDLRNTQVLWLTGVLGALLPASPKKGAPPAAVLAAYVFSVCQGALLAARMTGRVEDFDAAIDQLRSSLPA